MCAYIILSIVARISFSQSEFMVKENEEVIRVELVRSGDTSMEVIVLIASHPYEGSAAGIGMIIISILSLGGLRSSLCLFFSKTYIPTFQFPLYF